MTLTQRRWTYVAVISAMLALGTFIPGQRDERTRAWAGLSAGVVGICALAKIQ